MRESRTDFRGVKRKLEAHGALVITDRGEPAYLLSSLPRTSGRLAALNRAEGLSRTHTPKLGTRALDVLHVACASELKLRRFLTFDDRQQRLAAAVGLHVIPV